MIPELRGKGNAMTSLMHYILIDRRVVECADLLQWAKWFELATKDGSRHIAKTDIGEHWISTVFLGLDHNFFHHGPPILFETMVFSQKGDFRSDETMQRYATYEEAERGHNRLVEMVRGLEAKSIEITHTVLAIVRIAMKEDGGADK
jgi:hypothetical protein